MAGSENANPITSSLEGDYLLSSAQKKLIGVLERLLKLFVKPENNTNNRTTSWEKYLFSLDKADRSVINVAKFDEENTIDPEFVAKDILKWIFANRDSYTEHNQNPAVFLKNAQFEDPRIDADFMYAAVKKGEDSYTVIRADKNNDQIDQIEFKKFENVTLQQLQELGKIGVVINSHNQDVKPGDCWNNNQVLSSTWLSVDIDPQKIIFNSDHLVLDGYGIISMLSSLSQHVLKKEKVQSESGDVKQKDVNLESESEPLLSFEIDGSEEINLSWLRTAFLKTLEDEKIEGTILIPTLNNSDDPLSRIAIALASIKNARDLIVNNGVFKQRVSKLLKQEQQPVLSQIFDLLYDPHIPKKLQENLQSLVKKYPHLTLQLYDFLAGSALFSAPRVSVDSTAGYKIYANTMKNRQTDSINLVLVTLKEEKKNGKQKNTLCLSGAGRYTSSENLESFRLKLLENYRNLQEMHSKDNP